MKLLNVMSFLVCLKLLDVMRGLDVVMLLDGWNGIFGRTRLLLCFLGVLFDRCHASIDNITLVVQLDANENSNHKASHLRVFLVVLDD